MIYKFLLSVLFFALTECLNKENEIKFDDYTIKLFQLELKYIRKSVDQDYFESKDFESALVSVLKECAVSLYSMSLLFTHIST